jgi:hypothetical protein
MRYSIRILRIILPAPSKSIFLINSSANSGVQSTVTVDVAPNAPVIAALVNTTGAAGSHITDHAKVEVSGTADPGTTVQLFADGGNTAIGVGTTDQNGNFDIVASSSLTDGSHSLTAKATDPAQVTGVASAAFQVTVDVDAGEQPTLAFADTLIGSAGAATVHFTVGGLGADDTGVVTFTDHLGSHVTATASANGTFTADLHSLADGVVTASVVVTDTAGNSFSATSSNAAQLDQDLNEQNALAVTVNGGNPIGAAIATAVPLTVTGIESDDNGTVTFSDGVNAPAVVTITNGQLAPTANLAGLNDGTITVTLHLNSDAAGNTFTDSVFHAVLDTDAGQAATLSVAALINAAAAPAASFTVSGLDDSGTGTVTFHNGVNPDVVVNVSGNGTYSANLTSLADGPISSSLTFTDASGNPASAAGNTATLDTDAGQAATLSVAALINAAAAPAASFTVSGLDDSVTPAGNTQQIVENGHTYNLNFDQSFPGEYLQASKDTNGDTALALAVAPPTITASVGQPVNGSTLEVKGTATAGNTVTLYADSGATPVGAGVVAGDGGFDITTNVTFADATYALTATETTPGGFTSIRSTALPVHVDPTAPLIAGIAPDTGSSASDGITNAATVTVMRRCLIRRTAPAVRGRRGTTPTPRVSPC